MIVPVATLPGIFLVSLVRKPEGGDVVPSSLVRTLQIHFQISVEVSRTDLLL